MHAVQGILISIVATAVLTTVWMLVAGFMQLMKRAAVRLHLARKPETELTHEGM